MKETIKKHLPQRMNKKTLRETVAKVNQQFDDLYNDSLLVQCMDDNYKRDLLALRLRLCGVSFENIAKAVPGFCGGSHVRQNLRSMCNRISRMAPELILTKQAIEIESMITELNIAKLRGEQIDNNFLLSLLKEQRKLHLEDLPKYQAKIVENEAEDTEIDINLDD